MTYIKLLTALTALALLTACAGAVTINPTVNTGGGNTNNSNPCDMNPFGDDCGMDYEPARVKKIRECLIDNAAESPTCAPARAEYSCIDDPFTVACSNDLDFADYLNDARTMRTTYCEANPDETAFCAESVTFNNVCKDNMNIFNEVCFPAENPRRDACLGDVLDTLSDPSCATRPSVVSVCTDDPFTRTGCANVSTIGDLRTMYCGDKTTAWDDDCVEATYSVATDARNMACLDYGIDATKGGNALCAMRPNVIEACPVTAPFAYTVCDSVADINTGFRTTFCQMPANAFTTGCKTDGTHGDVDAARDMACLDGLATATGCDGRANVGTTCTSMPLPDQNAGCSNLSNYGMLLSDFCAMGDNAMTYLSGGCGTTAAAVCPNNLFNPSAIILGGGTIDCLGDASFAPARLTACATEAELNDCDTVIIAPEVCKDSGANANPFAVFCATATNIGGEKTVTEIRQSALDACPDSTKDTEVGICKNTIMTRATLNMECVLIADAFKPQCAYTQFNDERMGFCNDQSTAWDTGCDGETTYAGTTAMRDAACLADKTADMGYTGSDMRCGMRSGVASACTITDPFARVGCDNVANIDSVVRTMYCQTPATAWNPRCMDGMHGTVNATRVMACQMFGTSTNMGGDDSCAGSLASSCTLTDPFMYTGCKDVVGIAGVRMMYCQAPATAWDGECMNGTHGTVDTARVTACQMFGTGTGGDNSCATSLTTACDIQDPFAHAGCKDVEGIAGVRMMYCQAPATAWDEECMDGTHGMVTATRGEACLKFGIDTSMGGHASCDDNSLAKISCKMNPFDLANPGCAILTEFPMIVETYCTTTNPTADECAAKYSTWTDSFTSPALATAPVNRGGNIEVGFLSGLTKTQPTIAGFTSNSSSYVSATLADHNLGGDTNNGFAIWFGSWNNNHNNYYSGILTTTNVGTPLNNDKQDGTWRGRILAFNSFDGGIHKDFTFTVNFDAEEIYAFVASSGNSAFYEIEGSFEGGLLTGSVEYGQDNGGGSANGTLESGDGLYINGTLTGLIGADGAVGAFIGKRSDVAFSGGFVAVPPPPPAPNHATFKTYYADSAREVTERLHPTPTTTNATAAFLEGTATGLDTTGLAFPNNNTFMPVAVRLKEEATGDDGFALVYGTAIAGGNLRFRAGLLSGTDLGPAVATTGMATWAGSLHWANSVSRLVRVALPTVTVDFANGTIKTDAVTVRSNRTIAIDGLFRAGSNNNGLPVGILGGKAVYTDGGNPSNLPLIGLIGTEGAIGVFYETGVIGGFQASPSQ